MKQQSNARGPVFSRNSLGSRRTPYSRSSPSSNSGGVYSQSSGLVGQYEQHGSRSCYKCSGSHLKSACSQPTKNKRCYRCRTKGHLEKDCLLGRSFGIIWCILNDNKKHIRAVPGLIEDKELYAKEFKGELGNSEVQISNYSSNDLRVGFN
ncbi:hypothetical protein V8G54_009066 [Vigna mungo]|uniref:CCHC-type domain-containing protein n=1 Tax=Vigna mungo TaxID=3915 RepID=A0AAQ3S544_VIGMU